MVISGGTLVSDCHGAIIYMEGEEYRCMRCQQPCGSAGTLSEKYERDNAIPNEHARLKNVVVEKAKARRAAEKEFDKNPATAHSLLAAEIAEDTAVDALIALEKEHKIGE
jgi:hypothetical protein